MNSRPVGNKVKFPVVFSASDILALRIMARAMKPGNTQRELRLHQSRLKGKVPTVSDIVQSQ